ncbi:hypothetical protein O181_000398 [Austropuccinia psidii MF-1]|uniref:Uncharacterized protein n=1 Tax=Austropuccinia psidii MF-1 TaxID=1389203 RepID=A0A9Q3B8G8_9BASI|nr:hypothetical protein [Austropuccinia psidii MF-1]
MKSAIIQTSNHKYKRLLQQKEGGKQERSTSSFYQKATSQPTSSIGEQEKEKELKETILPKIQDLKNPKGFHGQCLQNGQNLDGIQGQRGAKNETTTFSKEINLSPDIVNTFKETENSILHLTKH